VDSGLKGSLLEKYSPLRGKQNKSLAFANTHKNKGCMYVTPPQKKFVPGGEMGS